MVIWGFMMSENDQTIDKTLLDRIFNQIDTNTSNVSELTRISGEHSSSIGILKKITIGIFLALIVGCSSVVFLFTEENVKERFTSNETEQSVMINEVGGDDDHEEVGRFLSEE